MKILNFLLSSLIVFLCQVSLAQTKIFIPLNNKECVSCLGSIHYLKEMNKEISRNIVFEKKYRRDSANLIKRLHLEEFASEIIWSDSLYNLFKRESGISSSVTAYNPESQKILKSNIARIKDNLEFFNSINKTRDTIDYENAVFGAEAVVANNASSLFIFDGISKSLQAYDKTDNQLLYTLTLSDSVIRAAFKLRFGKQADMKLSDITEYTQKWQTVDPQAFSNFYISDDTVYLLAQHKYMIYPSEGAPDTLTAPFFSLSKYHEGILSEFSIIENYLDSSMKQLGGGIKRTTATGKTLKVTYIVPGPFLVNDGSLYLQTLAGYAKGINNEFLAKYYFDKRDKTYKIDKLSGLTLPVVYDSVGYNFLTPGNIVSSNSYVSFYLSDSLFSLNDAGGHIGLNVFGSNGRKRKGIWDMKVSDHYAYLVYIDAKDNCYHYLKYNRSSNKVELDKVICNYKAPSFISTPVIDELDNDYVYYPIEYNKLLRRQMGSEDKSD